MTQPFTPITGAQTITTSERSLVGDTTVGVPLANTASFKGVLLLDCTAMAFGGELTLKIYTKVAAGTQRVSRTIPIVGTVGVVEIKDLWLYDGYDITLTKATGSDVAIRWALLEDVGDVNVAAISGDTAAADALESHLDSDTDPWDAAGGGALSSSITSQVWTPELIQIPATGDADREYLIYVQIRDANGAPIDADSDQVEIYLFDQDGNDLSANLSASPNMTPTGAGDGLYFATLTVSSSFPVANLEWSITWGLAAVTHSITMANSISQAAGALQSTAVAIKAKTDNLPSDPTDASVVAGLIADLATTLAALPAANATAVLATAIEGAHTVAQQLNIAAAGVAGKMTGLPSDATGTVTILGADGVTVRVAGTVASGTRTVTTRNGA